MNQSSYYGELEERVKPPYGVEIILPMVRIQLDLPEDQVKELDELMKETNIPPAVSFISSGVANLTRRPLSSSSIRSFCTSSHFLRISSVLSANAWLSQSK